MRAQILRYVGLALAVFSAVGCFKGVTPPDLKCTKDEACPTDHRCVIPAGQTVGVCQRGPVAADGGRTPDTADARLVGDVAIVDAPAPSGDADARESVDAGQAMADTAPVGVDAAVDAPVVYVPDAGPTPDAGLAPDTALPSPNGAPCAAAAACASGLCVDGVCCDSACAGQCESCKAPGSVGTCRPVQGAPLAPRAACAGTGLCQGQCDGKNGAGCAFPGSASVCAAASCVNGTATAASVCDGRGACSTATTTPCPSKACAADGLTCSGRCTATSCGVDEFCPSTGVCAPKRPLGSACLATAECQSGYCVDGVCCSSACAGQCQACNEPGKTGTCSRVTGAPRTGRAPCPSSVVLCAGTCDGSSDTQCAYPGAETSCAPATCSADLMTSTTASVCNGAGACSLRTAINCGATNSFCSGGACTPKLPNGGSCQTTVQCDSGNCSNGICCGAGRLWCGSACVDPQTSATHCGACNNACGDKTCMGGTCCAASDTKCGEVCCGPNHTCTAGTCACSGTTLSCGSCGSWGFDSGTTEGWYDPEPTTSGITAIAVNNTLTYNTKYALAVSLSKNGAVNVKPCASGISLAGYTLSAKVAFLGSGMANDGTCYAYLSFTSFPGFAITQVYYTSSWYDLTYTFPANPTNDESSLGVGVYCDGWSGTMHIDNVTLTPP